jgi:hypothetical protein
LSDQRNLAYVGLAIGIGGIITQPVIIDKIKGWFGKNQEREEDNIIEQSVLRRQAKTLDRLGVEDYYLDPHTKRFDFDLENSPVTLNRIMGSKGMGRATSSAFGRQIAPLSEKGRTSRILLRNLTKFRTTISTRNASNQYPHIRTK